MFYTQKAYFNAKGGPALFNLTHDVKRCLTDSKAKSGYIHVLSSYGTTGVKLMENDKNIQENYLDYIQKEFADYDANQVARRSRTGANKFHLMAALCGLELVIPFEQGRLLSSPFHEIVVLDFEPASGRREFILTVVGE